MSETTNRIEGFLNGTNGDGHAAEPTAPEATVETTAAVKAPEGAPAKKAKSAATPRKLYATEEAANDEKPANPNMKLYSTAKGDGPARLTWAATSLEAVYNAAVLDGYTANLVGGNARGVLTEAKAESIAAGLGAEALKKLIEKLEKKNAPAPKPEPTPEAKPGPVVESSPEAPPSVTGEPAAETKPLSKREKRKARQAAQGDTETA